MSDDQRGMDETLADIRELPATLYEVGASAPQNVAVKVTLPDGTVLDGTAIITVADGVESVEIDT